MSSFTTESEALNESYELSATANCVCTEDLRVTFDETIPSVVMENKILRMMVKMGYKSGSGLGKSEQGIVEPVNIKLQLGKRGLGLHSENFSCDMANWDSSVENINVKEVVLWLTNTETEVISYDTLLKWIVRAKPLSSVDYEIDFVDVQLLKDILKAKGVFDELNLLELYKARSRANPFETVRHVFFMNRAALKMANIDASTNFMFTNIDRDPHHRKTDKGPYYFADVCAGPGGFTEYVLWRKKWSLKGFGFTLKGEHDFKLHESSCMSGVTFQSYYGVNNDGNVCDPGNIQDFAEKVLHQTDGLGVHYMMSDGGFSVEGNENFQEVLSKQLYVCQCLVALEIVRSNGHFVTKLFDVFTRFSVGLVFLMHRCFDKVGIIKPNSSRPANSERYLICSGLKMTRQTIEIRQYLRTIVEELWNIKKIQQTKDSDIVEIVPVHILKANANFFRYIVDSNNEIGGKQKIGLLKLAAFCRNPLLTEPKQEILRSQCLAYWRLPDKPRTALPKLTVDELLTSAMYKSEFILVKPREVSSLKDLHVVVTDFREWHFLPLESGKSGSSCNFYASLGYSKVYKLQANKWIRVKNLKLCRGTLLYGELVHEQCSSKHDGEDNERRSLHVIDALRLGNISLADLPFNQRMDCIETYCKAANFEGASNTIRIRPKLIQPLELLLTNPSIFYKSDAERYFTNVPVLAFNGFKEFYYVGSILLLKTDENQSFSSTYVLRVQVFIGEGFLSIDSQSNYMKLDEIMNYIKRKS